jgi:hypothetical protein
MFGRGLGQIGSQVLADYFEIAGGGAMAHFSAGSCYLLCHASQHMAPHIGLAESHGIQRQAQMAIVIQARTNSPAFSS